MGWIRVWVVTPQSQFQLPAPPESHPNQAPPTTLLYLRLIPVLELLFAALCFPYSPRDLGSEDWRTREAAQVRIAAVSLWVQPGSTFFARLESDPDPEVSRRGAILARKNRYLQKRLEIPFTALALLNGDDDDPVLDCPEREEILRLVFALARERGVDTGRGEEGDYEGTTGIFVCDPDGPVYWGEWGRGTFRGGYPHCWGLGELRKRWREKR